MVLGLTGAVVLAHGAPEKAVAMVLVGLLLGLVGIDVNTGAPRMTLGFAELGDGIGFVPIAIGMFGIAELAVTLGRPQDRSLLSFKLSNLWPTRGRDARSAFRRCCAAPRSARVLGVLPGGGAALSSFAAYALEKKIVAHAASASAAAPSRAWRRPRPPTTPARRRASFRC